MIVFACIVCFITFLMLIWLKSEAIIEWGSLFGLSKILKIDEFYKTRIEYAIKGIGFGLNYPTFLKEKYHYNFITTMLACPLCLSVWLSIIAGITISIVLLKPLALFLIPVITVSSLLLYGGVTYLLKL